jgi:hypothetical protein
MARAGLPPRGVVAIRTNRIEGKGSPGLHLDQLGGDLAVVAAAAAERPNLPPSRTWTSSPQISRTANRGRDRRRGQTKSDGAARATKWDRGRRCRPWLSPPAAAAGYRANAVSFDEGTERHGRKDVRADGGLDAWTQGWAGQSSGDSSNK